MTDIKIKSMRYRYILLFIVLLAIAGSVLAITDGTGALTKPSATDANLQYLYTGPYVDIQAELNRRAASTSAADIAVRIDTETGLAAPMRAAVVDEEGNILAESVTITLPW